MPSIGPMELIIVLVMTPFQAAGEEYLFRGWLMQNVGAYFSRPIIGLVVLLALMGKWIHAAGASMSDPLGLSGRARMAHVYAAEAVLGLPFSSRGTFPLSPLLRIG